jgi:hypothetical protein
MNEKQMKEFLEFKAPDYSDEEIGYRRGYCHGIIAAKKNPNLCLEDAYLWRYSDQDCAPPGSAYDGMHLHGLRRDETHRFFINTMKKMANE